MKKSLNILLALIVALFTVSFGGNSVFADGTNIEDGEYEVSIITLEADSDEESIAGEFMGDTADLSIEGDDINLTLEIAKGGEGEGEFGDFDFDIEWVTVEGKEHESEEDGGTVKYFTFSLDSLQEVLSAGMEYVVPGFPGLEDGHEVEFRIQLEGLDELPEATEDSEENGEDEENGENETGNGNDEENGENGSENDGNGTVNNDDNGVTNDEDNDEENPQTGDSSNILLYGLLLIGALIPLTVILIKRRSA